MRNVFEYYEDDDFLSHHGIKGQKWGVRRFQNPDGTWTNEGKIRYNDSVAGNAHRIMAKVYDLNARAYNKLGNKTLASMNEAAKDAQLKKANNADLKKKKRIDAKREADKKAVDVSLAKNSATKRTAEDYHRLTDKEFSSKYHTTRKTFAKRYQKTKGDTYSLGRRKQALAIAYLDRMQGKSLKRTAADIVKYDMASKAEQAALDRGHEYVASAIRTTADAGLRRIGK